jgi:hypothetical protein
MTSWEQEKLDLLVYYDRLRGCAVALEEEINAALNSLDIVSALVRARRALEVILEELCEQELKRKRGTEPLAGLLSRFKEAVPESVLVAMRFVNELGNLGAHPKPVTAQEVKQAFVALVAVLHWYVVEYKQGFGERGEAPPAGSGAAAAPLAANPYVGLDTFEEKDADRFFGREEFVEQTLWPDFQVLTRSPPQLLALLGPSGSGKSSVARAGFLPLLTARFSCRSFTLTPTRQPLDALANRLARHALPDDPAPAGKAQEFRTLLDASEQGLTRIAALLWERDRVPLVLLLDQAEELFSLCPSAEEQGQFLANLLTTIADPTPHLYLLLTLRSDFLGETQRFPAFNTLLMSHARFVPVLDEAGLRRAIAEPARRAGRPLQEGMVQLLVEQSVGREGGLPLLQYALAEIWRGLEAGRSAEETLRACGGVGGALAGRAQQLYEALAPEEQVVARRCLLKLIQLGEGSPDTRRRVAVDDLLAEGESRAELLVILRRFAAHDARFLTFSRGTDDREQVEITHDALITHWGALGEWLKADRDDLRLAARLEAAAKHWRTQDEATGLLWRRPDLDLLRRYVTRHGTELTPLQSRFYHAACRQERRERLVKRGAVAVLLVLTLAALAFAGLARWQQQVAVEQRKVAESQQRAAEEAQRAAGEAQRMAEQEQRRAESQQLAAQAELLGKQQANLLPQSVLLATEAMERSPTFAADQTMYHGLSLLGPKPVEQRSYLLAQGSVAPRARKAPGGLNQIVLSPHGKYLVQLSWDGPIHVQETASGKEIATFINLGPDNSPVRVRQVFFSDNDNYIATVGSLGRSTFVWQLPSGREVFRTLSGGIMTAALSPDGNYLATGDVKDMVHLWKIPKSTLIMKPRKNNLCIFALSTFCADPMSANSSGNQVLSFSHPDHPHTIMFGPDGRYLAVTSSTGNPKGPASISMVRLWDVVKNQEIAQLQHSGAVTKMAFSPDRKYLAITSEVGLEHEEKERIGTVKVWETATGQEVTHVQGYECRLLA